MGTPHVTEDTRSEICRILAWDLKQLESGTYAFVDHSGRFHPLGSARERLAGQQLSVESSDWTLNVVFLEVCVYFGTGFTSALYV